MKHPNRTTRAALIGSLALGLTLSGAGIAVAGSGPHGAGSRQHNRNAYIKSHGGGTTATHTPDDGDLADQQAQYDAERTAPAGVISGQPLVDAQQQAATLPVTGSAWQQFTNQPYNAQPSNYTDPFWGNEGAGFSLVGGRVTALATTPDGTWFAGAADGGVWRSKDQGQNWTPVFDSMPTLSIGALAVDPVDGSLWVGTGEANVSQDSYAGTGIYRSTNDGATFKRVGDDSRATTRWPRTRCSGSRSTRAATPTRPPTTGCSGTPPAPARGPRSWIPPVRMTSRPTTSR